MNNLNDLENVVIGDPTIIEQISQSGENFNKQMAQYLIKSCTSSQNIKLIIDCLKSLHTFCINVNQTLTPTFYEAYDYVQIFPLFAKEIPHIEISWEATAQNATSPTERFNYLCKRSSRISQEIADLCKKIMRLECDKRQPLELFDLQKRYEDLKNQYEEICKEQFEAFEKIKKKYK
jgi:hypothetical protein